MSQSPPPPPSPVIDPAAAHAQWAAAEASLKPVRRVVRVATFDAWTIAIFAAPTFICGLFGGVTGVLLGGAMAVIAFVEFKNARQLRRLDLSSLDRLALNQLALAGVLTLYAAWSIYALHGGGLLAGAKSDVPELDPGAIGVDPQLDRLLGLAVYGSLVVITVLAQGGMALYYFNRRRRLQTLVAAMPAWVVDLQRTQNKS